MNAAGKPAQRHAEPARACESHRMPLDRRADPAGQPEREADQNATEDAAEHAAQDRANRHHDPGGAQRQHGRRRAEVMIFAQQRQRGEAGGDDGADDEAGGTHLEGAAQLFDGKDDAGERRVERGGDAGRRPREQEAGLAIGREAAERGHDGAADLHRRSLAAGRGAEQKAERHHHDLAETDAQGDQRAALLLRQLQRRNHLWNAGPLGVGEDGDRQPHAQRKTERRHQQARIGRTPEHETKQMLRLIRKPCHGDGSKTDTDPAGHKQHVPGPALACETGAEAKMREIAAGLHCSGDVAGLMPRSNPGTGRADLRKVKRAAIARCPFVSNRRSENFTSSSSPPSGQPTAWR